MHSELSRHFGADGNSGTVVRLHSANRLPKTRRGNQQWTDCKLFNFCECSDMKIVRCEKNWQGRDRIYSSGDMVSHGVRTMVIAGIKRLRAVYHFQTKMKNSAKSNCGYQNSNVLAF